MLLDRSVLLLGFPVTAMLIVSMLPMLLAPDEDALKPSFEAREERPVDAVQTSIHAKTTQFDANRRATSLNQNISLPVDLMNSDHTASLPDQDPHSEVTAPAPQPERDILLSAEQNRALPAGIVLASKNDGASLVPGGHSLSPERNPATPSAQAMALSKPVQSTNDQRQGNATHGRISQTSAHTYGTKVWAALARHKPNGHRDGTAAVAFDIDTRGALRHARISRSSGNAQVDRMALATVRNAAPFPTPPAGLKDEELSYAIRIHFP